jgi:[ribosomal protein S5]-alanine N-acetyltransferase
MLAQADALRVPPPPVLRTARLLLRPLTLTDAPDVFAYVQDPEVLRYTTGRTPTQLAETEAFLRAAMSSSDTDHWGICIADSEQVVGVIELSLDPPGRASIHYTLARAQWGKGLMTEAARAICDWAFGALPHLGAIKTPVAVQNVGSTRVLEKLGFRRVRRTSERWEKESSPVELDWYVLPRDVVRR